jgi:hypothetical protein
VRGREAERAEEEEETEGDGDEGCDDFIAAAACEAWLVVAVS